MSWFNLSDNINLLTVIAAIALIIITFIAVAIYFKDIKDGRADGEISKEDWDGIKEYKNPLPLGWSIIFILTTVWGIWYMYFGYPLNAYSQLGEYNEEVAEYNKNFQDKWSNANKTTLLQMGESIFLVQCAACHGIEANGIEGKAADFTVWGSEDGAIQSTTDGSVGLGYDAGEMLPMAGGTLESEAEIKQAVAYMMKHISTSGKSVKNPIGDGEEIWNNSCVACHGEDGAGMDGFGPDLTKYGTPDFVVDVLNRGKNGHIGNMPNYKDQLLSDIQKLAVATYVTSLSK